MLSRFFKPKWQHNDAEVRRRAIDALADDADEILSDLARNDPNPEVRCAALKRLDDLHQLELIIATDKNPRVQEQASQRLWGLIAGTLAGLDAEQRLAALQRHQEARLIEHIARHGCDVELRCVAVSRVSRAPLLLEVLESDTAIKVRLAALDGLQADEHLEQVCKLARGRDKRLYRAARERLEKLQQQQRAAAERQQRFATLCTRAEALLKCVNMDGVGAALAQIQREWQALATEVDPVEASVQRFAEAVVAVGEMEQAHRERVARRAQGAGKVCADIEALLADIEHPVEPPSLETLEQGLAAAEQAWTVAREDADDDERVQYHSLIARLREQVAVQRRQLDSRRRATAVVEQAERAVAGGQPVDARQLSRIQRDWPAQAIAAGEVDGLPVKRYNAAIKTLQQRLQQQREQANAQTERAGELMDALEQALEAGETRVATRVQQQIQAIEKSLTATGLQLPASLTQRMQRQQGRLRELLDWQRFSNTAEREQLCEQVEGLIGAELAPQELAKQIKGARSSWNALGSTDRDAIGKLRDRFNKACDQAFEPCAEFYRQEAAQRTANMVDRTALIKRLQDYVANTDWEHFDVKGVEQVTREARDAWKAIGPVDHKAFKKAAGQFHATLDIISGHLRKAREANLRLKEGLIKRAEALTGEDIELDRAMDGIRDLQGQWKQLGPGPRREEQALWKRLQQAGDQVFARRNSERDAFKQGQQQLLAVYTTLCDRLQALVDATEPQPVAVIRHTLDEVEQAWSEADDLPGRARGELDRRYAKLVAALQQVIRQQQQAAQTEQHRLAAEAALLLAELEAVGDGDARGTLDARWQGLTDEQHYPARHYLRRDLLQQRWQRAMAAAPGTPGDPAAAERLCLQMEVAAGAESPPEATEARMALQVERLNQGFHSAEQNGDTANELRALEKAWWQLEGLGAAAPALTRRFLKARDEGYQKAWG